MKRAFQVLILLCLASVAAAGVFDRFKKAAGDAVERKIDQEINQTIDSVDPGHEPADAQDDAQKQAQDDAQNDASSPDAKQAEAAHPIRSQDDLYGQWEGGVVPAVQSLMDRVTLKIVITPDVASMRVQGAGTHCLAELTPTDSLGRYDAAILDQQAVWGTKASVSFSDGGQVSVDWIDAPNTPADKRVYSGKLNRTLAPSPRRQWSASLQQRQAFDVVGFTLGMTYEQAIAYREAHHQDLEPAVSVVRDGEGAAASIIYALKEKNAPKYGGELIGEQVTLGFESQTAQEMEVEQDPQTLALIEKRQTIIDQRTEAQRARAQQGRSPRGRNQDAVASQDALPEIPDMPKLRPQGADAQLLFISRSVRFTGNQGPSKDKIIKALTDKYGSPSIQIEPRPNRIKLAWIFDASADRITHAEGGPFDDLTHEPSAMKNREKFYSVALTAARASDVFDLVTVSPESGLILKAQIEVGGGGAVQRVTTTVYDAQRLLGDEWYRTAQFYQASVAAEKAKAKTIQARDVPDF